MPQAPTIAGQQTWQLSCKFHSNATRLWFVSDMHGLPDFPKACVLQGCCCTDAFIGVIGKHLIEQRQSRSRAAGDQPWDTGAFSRGEVEIHCSRSARQKQWDVITYKHIKNRWLQLTYKNEEHLPLELLEDAWIWCPQHVVDLINLVQLAGSREERVQTKTHMGIEQTLSHNKRY